MHHKSRYAIIKRSNKSKKIIYSIDAQNDYQNLLTQISFYRAYQVKRGQIFCAISSKIRNGLARIRISIRPLSFGIRSIIHIVTLRLMLI